MHPSLSNLPLLLTAFVLVLNGALGASPWDKMKRLADEGVLPWFSQEPDGFHMRLPGVRGEGIIRIVTSSSSSSSSSASSSSSSSSSSYSSDVCTLVTRPKSTRLSTPTTALSSSNYLSAKELPNEALTMAATLSMCSYDDRSLKDETQALLQRYCKGTNREVLYQVPDSTVEHIYNIKGNHVGLVLCQPGRCTWIALAGTQDLEDVWMGARGLVDVFIGGKSESVHAGYKEYAKAIAVAVRKVLRAKDFDNEVIMCGHSAGGALCLLMTEEIPRLKTMSRSNTNNQLKWITFGMPAFVNPSHSSIIPPGCNSRNHLRIANNSDLVVREGIIGTDFAHGTSPAIDLDDERVALGNEFAAIEDAFPLTRIISVRGVTSEALKKTLQGTSAPTRDSGTETFGSSKGSFEEDEFELLKKVGTLVAKKVKGTKQSHGMFGYLFAVMDLGDRKDK